VGALGSSLSAFASNARASATDGGNTFAVETTRYVIANVPSYFEEIDLGESDAAAAYETLLRDKRFRARGKHRHAERANRLLGRAEIARGYRERR
jgi:hypothetical protein